MVAANEITQGHRSTGRSAARRGRCDRRVGNSLVRKRTYNPPLGRWVQRDPIGYKGGVNLFGYAGSAPVAEVDPPGTTVGNADTYTFGEIGAWAIVSAKNLRAPAGLADAKASVAAVCPMHGGQCAPNDGSAYRDAQDKAAWANIVNANNGQDRSGGGNYMCVGSQGCWFVHSCYKCDCKTGKKVRVERPKRLATSGTVVVHSTRGGTLYFYKDPLEGWCNRHDYIHGCKKK